MATTDTLSVLTWASSLSTHDELVGTFWRKLCETVGEPADASPEAILAELCAFGGNSIANLFRGGGVPYEEVAREVAGMAKGVFERRTYDPSSLLSCEAFLLTKMEVGNDDIEAMAQAIDDRGSEDAWRRGVGALGAAAAARASAQQAAAFAARAAAQAVARKAAAQATTAAAKRAAAKVAAKVTQTVLARIALAMNVVTAAWLVVDLAGPATRKILPGTTYVAILRRLHDAAAEER